MRVAVRGVALAAATAAEAGRGEVEATVTEATEATAHSVAAMDGVAAVVLAAPLAQVAAAALAVRAVATAGENKCQTSDTSHGPQATPICIRCRHSTRHPSAVTSQSSADAMRCHLQGSSPLQSACIPLRFVWS